MLYSFLDVSYSSFLAAVSLARGKSETLLANRSEKWRKIAGLAGGKWSFRLLHFILWGLTA